MYMIFKYKRKIEGTAINLKKKILVLTKFDEKLVKKRY